MLLEPSVLHPPSSVSRSFLLEVRGASENNRLRLMASARPIRRVSPAPAPRPRPRYEDAAALYGIPYWGKGFFHVSEEGDLVVRPTREAARGVVLKQIVDEVALRGITTPMIVRFPQILATSVANLNDAFARSIEEFEYGNVF